MPQRKLTHLDSSGRARMVDVSAKPATRRLAIARGYISLQPRTLRAIAEGKVPKGEVLSVARTAGIMAAKKCGELIPLAHPLGVESVDVDFEVPQLTPTRDSVKLGIKATATITAKTGVEMEALTAVAMAALTIYDMCKAIDRTMAIGDIRLVKKTGGSKAFKTGK